MRNLQFLNVFKNENIRVHNSVNGNNEIDIDGQIGMSLFSDGYTFEKFKRDLEQVQGDITINIKSYGGDLFEALAIHDMIRALNQNVTTKIVGATASSGTVISFAGDTRLISKNSRYLIHKPMIGAFGNSDEISGALETLKDLDKQLVAIYAERSVMSEEEILSLMIKNTWISPADALKYGFVDGYIEDKSQDKVKDNNINNNKILNEMEVQKLYDLLGVTNEEGVFDKIKELQNSVTNEGGDEDTKEVVENTTEETPENTEETSTEVINKEDDNDDEPEDEKDKLIKTLKEEIEDLKAKLKVKEVEDAENAVTEMENLVNAAIAENKINADAKDTYLNIGEEKGLDTLKTVLNSIKVVEKPKKFSEVIENTKNDGKKDEREIVVNKWKAGEISTGVYLNTIKTLK